jgi:transcriptional regulator with XRE-family HTH domain
LCDIGVLSTPNQKAKGKLMTSSQPLWIDVVNPEDKRFFKELGTRIAELRKAQGFTQQQLADALGLSQQMIASYEVGRRRVPISMLPTLAIALAAIMDDLVTQPIKPGKRGPAPKLQQQMDRISQLPRPKQRFVLEVLEAALVQASR